ncbi:MAG: hypothetical protein A3K67_07750 [Euryarchaeota archaeon RBG_16_62_10]|nr:MAG: hypothetical protein A3K67_07750 [Euryarchaeota archaeon RBG_16_62_10]
MEIPLPELGGGKLSLKSSARAMEKRIKDQTPADLRRSIVVKPFRKGERTGLVIEFDDRAENFVYVAMEYPRGGGKKESVAPHR